MSQFSILVFCLSVAGFVQSKSVTYPGIGTFHSDDFHDPIHRPFSDIFLPQSPEHIHPEFLLFTRNNPHDEEKLHWNDTAGIKASKFYNSSLPTKFFVHGFMDNQWFGPYMKVMKDRFLEYEPLNMIIVDWSKGNGLPYSQASVNTRVVGPMIAIQAEALIREKGGNLDNFHLLGHSLGAHVVGNAGKFLKGKLGRITGLDPAGPLFEHMVPEARLWHTDAQFVDSIHTDSRMLLDRLGFGMMETCSHVDIFPNGGRDQPGCTEDRLSFILKDIISGIRTMVACSHQRAVDFYMDTLSHKAEIPKAYQCDSWDHFKEGKCMDCGTDGEKCIIIGPRAGEFYKKHAKSLDHGKRFFIATNHHEPYFQWNYLIKIKIAGKGKDHHEEHGKVMIKFNDKSGNHAEVQFGKEKTFKLGETYSEVVVSTIDPLDVDSLELHWSHRILDLLHSKMYIEGIELDALSSHTSTMTSLPEALKFCSPDTAAHGVETGKNAHFAKC